MIEIVGADILVAALTQPFQDIYNSAKGATKEKLKWLNQASEIRSLYGRISDVGTIRTINSRQPVSIRSIYYPAKIKTRYSEVSIDTANDLSNGASKHIVITGTIGQGKSVFLKYLCIREIETGSGFPIFIELRNTSEKISLNSLLKTQLAHLGFQGESEGDNSHVELLFSRKLVTLFLDGYDEVKKNAAASVRDEIHSLVAKYPKLRIIVSSRPSAISHELDRLSGFNYLEINPLRTKDFDPFLKKIGTTQETRERLLTAIQQSQTEIRELLTTPLMLTLVVTACGTRPTLPDTLPDFYDALFGVMVATHDETKPGYVREKSSKLSNSQLENLFKAFCFASKDEAGTNSLTPKEFSASHSKAIAVIDLECSVESFKADLIDVVCLMAKDGLNIAFIHKSIQEYFASTFISDLDDDEVVKKIYERIRKGNYREWNQELLFLKSTDIHRCNKFYHLPSIESTLSIFAYSPDKRLGVTTNDIRSGIKILNPSVSLNEDDDGLALAIPVDAIMQHGIRDYVFQVFAGVTQIFEDSESSDMDNPNLDSYASNDLVDLIGENSTTSKEVYELIRDNLKKLHQKKIQIEKSIQGRNEKLLSIVMASKFKKNRADFA